MKKAHIAAVAIGLLVIAFTFAQTGALKTSTAGNHEPGSAVRPDLSRVKGILEFIRGEASSQHDVWFDDGDFPRSVQSLKILHSLFPADYSLLTDLGWMLENIQENSSALITYKKYATRYPEDAEAAYPEAEFYFRNKLWSKVPPIIEPSLKLKPHPHPNSYRILARSYEMMGLLKDSQRVWDEYLAIDPNDGQAKVNLARVLKKMRGKHA